MSDIINENCLLTLREIDQGLRRRLPVKPFVHNRTIGKVLVRTLVRVKLARPLSAEKNKSDVIQMRIDYASWFMTTEIVNYTLLIDECR